MNLKALGRRDLGFVPVLLTLIAVAIFFQISTKGIFLLPRNLSNLTLQIATIGTVGLGAALVLLLGEIDLSLATVATLCGAIVAVLIQRNGWNPFAAILAGILAGMIIGFINGIFIALLHVPSFIVTLAAAIGYSGVIIALLPEGTLSIRAQSFTNISAGYLPTTLGIALPAIAVGIYVLSLILTERRRAQAGLQMQGAGLLLLRIVLTIAAAAAVVVAFSSYLGVPQSPTIMLALVVLFWLILTRTQFGRFVYAVGGNAEASRRAGVNVPGLRIAVFILASTLAAIGGILNASRATGVSPQINPTLLLNAIAAAVIGGISLFGGRGSVWAVVIGALIIGSLENGLDLLNQGQDVKNMVQGAVLLLAVTIDAVVRRRSVNQGR